jgi:hypothetical protein
MSAVFNHGIFSFTEEIHWRYRLLTEWTIDIGLDQKQVFMMPESVDHCYLNDLHIYYLLFTNAFVYPSKRAIPKLFILCTKIQKPPKLQATKMPYLDNYLLDLGLLGNPNPLVLALPVPKSPPYPPSSPLVHGELAAV